MAKVRVHELAKKYDVPSKDVLTMLGELGEFVKAPSSTVEPPVVKRFEDKYGADLSAKAEAKAAKKAAKKAPAKKAAPAPEASEDAAPAEAPAEETVEAPAAKAAAPRPGPRSKAAEPEAEAPAEPEPAAEPEAPAASADTATEDTATQGGDGAAPSEGARFKPGPRPARPGAPRPGNNPFSSTQGMGSRSAPAPVVPARAPATSVRPARRRVAATACRAPTRR